MLQFDYVLQWRLPGVPFSPSAHTRDCCIEVNSVFWYAIEWCLRMQIPLSLWGCGVKAWAMQGQPTLCLRVNKKRRKKKVRSIEIKADDTWQLCGFYWISETNIPLLFSVFHHAMHWGWHNERGLIEYHFPTMLAFQWFTCTGEFIKTKNLQESRRRYVLKWCDILKTLETFTRKPALCQHYFM